MLNKTSNNQNSRLQNQMQPATSRFKIEVFDNQLHTYKPLDSNGVAVPLMKGILVHVVVVGIFIFGSLSLPIDEPQPLVETTLVTPEQLASIQSQILANRSATASNHDANTLNPNTSPQALANTKNKAVNKASHTAKTTSNKAKNSQSTANKNSPTNNTTAKNSSATKNNSKANASTTKPATPTDSNTATQIEPSAEAVERNKRIASRQSQFEQALKAFTKEEEDKIKAKKQQRLDAKRKKAQQERELVEVFKKVESESKDADKDSNKNSQQTAENTKTDQTKKASNSTNTDTKRTLDKATQALANTVFSEKSYQNQGLNKTQTTRLGLAVNKIGRHLHPPANSGKDTTIIRITVNANGDVIRVFSTGRNPALNRAVEQAVQDASPLPISPNDIYYPTFSIEFEGKGDQ